MNLLQRHFDLGGLVSWSYWPGAEFMFMACKFIVHIKTLPYYKKS